LADANTTDHAVSTHRIVPTISPNVLVHIASSVVTDHTANLIGHLFAIAARVPRQPAHVTLVHE
jgi:hypothetical protein